MPNYKDENFNISEIPNFNNTDGFIDISDYLDFAISTTILKQQPDIDFDIEKRLAKKLLNNYINDNSKWFTSSYGIRSNINRIVKDKIRYLLISTTIERHAYNLEVSHLLNSTTESQMVAENITQKTKMGQLDTISEYVNKNMAVLIDDYINTKYKISKEEKRRYLDIAYINPITAKAMEQLNLEMRMQSMKRS